MGQIYLTELRAKQTAVVKALQGGGNATRRLESLGIRPGKKITMISSHFWKGPVTVLVDKSKVAIGHGMASKIIVETENG